MKRWPVKSDYQGGDPLVGSGHMDLWLLAAEKLSKVLISSILVSLYIRVKGHEVEQ